MVRLLEAGVFRGEGPGAGTGPNRDAVAGGGRVEGLENVALRQVQPGLLRIRNEQTVFDEPARQAGDDAVQQCRQVRRVGRVASAGGVDLAMTQ